MKNLAKYTAGLALVWLAGFLVSAYAYSFAHAAAKVVTLVLP